MAAYAARVGSFRFGILGTGNIARQFAAALATSRRCRVTAVGSRQPAQASAFCSSWAPGADAGSYESLLARQDIDAVYVALPNALHYTWTLAALRAGKHVLCEKPLAMNSAEAEEMFDAAGRAGRLLVEAFMYVSHPLHAAASRHLADGTLGTLRHVRTSFCFRARKVAGNVRFDRSLGGGALLDVGCYCVHFSRRVAAIALRAGFDLEPDEVAASAVRHRPSGVDELVSAVLLFRGTRDGDSAAPAAVTASFTCGLCLQADNTATVCGEDAFLELPVPWKPPVVNARLVLARAAPPRQDQPHATTTASSPPVASREELGFSADRELYALEADDFADAAEGLRPPTISRADSLANARTLDRLRRLIGD